MKEARHRGPRVVCHHLHGFHAASGIVGFQFALAAAISGVFVVGDSALQFVFWFLGGGFLGLLLGGWGGVVRGTACGHVLLGP